MMVVPVVNRFLHWSAVGILSPVLVLLIMSKGIPVETVGIVMALSSASIAILELPSGILSDLIGRRRVYLLSILLAIAALSAIYLARGAAGLCLGFVLYGASRAFSSGSIEAAYVDDYIARNGKEKLHSLISAMSVGEASGLAIGALAGGYIPILWARLHPSGNEYDGNILAQILALCALLVLTVSTGYRDTCDPHMKLGPFIGESKEFLRGDKVLRLLLAGVVVWGFFFNAIEVFWQPRLQEIVGRSGDTQVFGLINSGYFLAAALGNLLVGALLSKRRVASLPLVGVMRILSGLSAMLMATQNGAEGFAVFFLAIMCFNGMMSVPEATALNALIPNDKRASFLSLSSLAMQLGGMAAALIFSLVKRRAAIGTIWIIAGSLFLLSSTLYFAANGQAPRSARSGHQNTR